MKKARKRESGRSMIEIVGVLAVTGLLTAGAFVLIQSGMASQKRNRAADEINTMAQAARATSAAQGNFYNLPYQETNQLPPRSIKNSWGGLSAYGIARVFLKNNASTPFGDSSYYAVSETWVNSSTGMMIWIVDLPSEDCETMALRAYTNGSGACKTIGGKKVLQVTYTK